MNFIFFFCLYYFFLKILSLSFNIYIIGASIYLNTIAPLHICTQIFPHVRITTLCGHYQMSPADHCSALSAEWWLLSKMRMIMWCDMWRKARWYVICDVRICDALWALVIGDRWCWGSSSWSPSGWNLQATNNKYIWNLQVATNKDIWTLRPPTRIFETSRHAFFSADDGCSSTKKAIVDDLIILCIKFPRKLSFPRNLTSVPITRRNQSTKSDFVCRTSVHDYVSIINTVLTFGNSLFLLLERTISSKRPIFIIDNMPTL